jgi:hypothetical protein
MTNFKIMNTSRSTHLHNSKTGYSSMLIKIKKYKISRELILTYLAIVLGALLSLWIFSGFWFETVLVYGDKSMEGARVYIDNSLAGTMVWDEKGKRTYARDDRWILLPSKLLSGSDHLLIVGGSAKVEFKVVTRNNRTYKDVFTNGEDVAYIVYFDVRKFKSQE